MSPQLVLDVPRDWWWSARAFRCNGGYSGRIKTAPEGVGSTRRGLTHSSDLSREGLA